MEPIQSYLIQRAEFEQGGPNGIDTILKFHNMGSAEFEFGALPSSIKAIRNNINEYTYLDIPINGKIITVFCNDALKTEMKTYLTRLAKGRIKYLKEKPLFKEYINDEETYINTDFWWDIENHFMFWKKNVDFEKQFKNLI